MPYADPNKREQCRRAYAKKHRKELQTYARSYHMDYRRIAARRARQRRKENKAFLLSFLKRHPCVDCGEDDFIVLEFDHVRGKRAAISNLLPRRREVLLAELDRCEVRCANCHKRRHYHEGNRSSRRT